MSPSVREVRDRLDEQLLRLGRDLLARVRGDVRDPDEDRRQAEREARLFLVCDIESWDRAQFEGSIPWTEAEQRNGFVRLSTPAAVAGTLRRLGGDERVLLLSLRRDRVDAELLGRGLLPRYHGRVPVRAVVAAHVVAPGGRGGRELPRTVVRRSAEQVDAGSRPKRGWLSGWSVPWRPTPKPVG